MTDAGGWPEIMHGPHHRLAALQYLADALEREHTLIDPREMDDVSLLKLPQLGDVGTSGSHIYLPQMQVGEMEMPEGAPALPEKIPLQLE